MSLILYPETEKDFSTNGIGILSDSIDAEVYEVLNSQFELTLRYPVTGLHFESIVPDAYITAKPNPVDRPQPFRIYRVTKPMRGTVTVYARHVAYNNRKIAVTPFVAVGAPQALQGLKSYAVNDSPFTFWTDVDTEGTLQVKVPTDAWSLMGNGEGSILNIFGGEYQFDHWDIRLLRRRGADRGVVIRYGKNLTDLTQDENIADMFTGVCPFWAQSDGELMMLPEKTRSGPGVYAEEKILPLDATSAFSERPTEEQLRVYADQYIEENSIGTPAVSLTVEFAQPDHTDELSGIALLEQVLLGDTVSVFFQKLKVNATARAVAARYLPLLGRYKNITLGSVTPNLARTVAQQGHMIEKGPHAAVIQSAVNNATGWITSGGGYIVAVKNADGRWMELCSLDVPDIDAAQNVWRWNNGGFGFSKSGYAGPYETAITQDGHILASFISSILDDARLSIDGASLELFSDDKKTVSLTNESRGLPILYMHDLQADERIHSCELSPHHLKVGGSSLMPVFYLSAGNDEATLWLNGETEGKTLDWKDNGDGTFSLIGR